MTPPTTSFFTPGRRLQHEDSYIIVDQSYVHYRPPVLRENAPPHPPILFVHGGGLTGAMWESTPDLRPGWAVLASEAGYPLYIPDTVDNGRSMRAPDHIRPGKVEHRTAKQMWSRFRFGPLDKFEERELFPTSQFPIEHYDMLVAGQAARRRMSDEVEIKGIIEAIKILGECWVIAHSHGAALMIDVIKDPTIRRLVKQIALVEPGGTSKAHNLTNEIRTLVVWGDYLDIHDAWPLIAKPFEQAPVEIMHLPKAGLAGNTHFPMCDKNSKEVFERILSWLETK